MGYLNGISIMIMIAYVMGPIMINETQNNNDIKALV